MRGTYLIGLLALLLVGSAVPAFATPVQIQLGTLVPTGSCVPTTSTTCSGPTSVSTFVAGVGTITISGFSVWPNTAGNIAVTLDPNAASVPYLGIIGGNNEDEIDVQTSEVLQIAFSQPMQISTIDLNKLFLAGVVFDTNNEVAGINFLSSACPNSFCGTNTYSGTANGLLTLNNPLPFNWTSGPLRVDALQFWAVPTSNSTFADNSDFGVSALTVSPVPEPGTLILLGSGLAALAARRRLRRTNSLSA